MYDPNTSLSPNFTLKSLTVTNQQLSQPNEPTSADHYNNLVLTADALEQLLYYIGPFNVLSGYRTKELQNALTAAGEPTSKGLSFHEIGRGIDIAPTTMSLTEFYGKLLADENLRNLFAEIAIKPSQNSIHLAINVPGDVRQPKITGLNTEGVYATLSLDDIANYIAPYMASAEEAYDYAAAKLVSYNKLPLYLALGLGLLGAGYFLLGKKSVLQKNPRIRTKAIKPFRHLSDAKLISLEKRLGKQVAQYGDIESRETHKKLTKAQRRKLGTFFQLHDELLKRKISLT